MVIDQRREDDMYGKTPMKQPMKPMKKAPMREQKRK
jgi:hypothetical protein